MRILFIIFSFCLCSVATAQTADGIIEKYLEVSGGEDNWRQLSSTKMIGEVDHEGMMLPITIYHTKEGKQAIKIDWDGQEVTQIAYDGDVLWATNSNMKAQKADEESTQNMKYSTNDFPTPFLDYKKKNYQAKYIGTSNVQGKQTYKVLLVQEPITIDGLEEESISYYYFDVETHLPIMVEKEVKGGPMDGQMSVSTMDDYREVKGLYFPFKLYENGQELVIDKVVLDPKIKDSVFEFPRQ